MTAHLVSDSATMLRRSLRRMRRYPSLTFFVAAMPVLFLVVFVWVLGGAMGAGLGSAPAGGRDVYLAYVMPGILVLTVVGSTIGTAISVAMDMTNGIIARFRTMAIARSSVLAGHVLGTVIQTLLAGSIVLVVALVMGFRPTTAPPAWLAAFGLLVLACVTVSWLSVGMGLVTDSVETASNLPQVFLLLFFLSSAFVPTATLPEPLRTFATYQPFTPIIETVRGLLYGTDIGSNGIAAIAWCVALSAVGFVWSLRLYNRDFHPRAA
jgi:ABC-2 type transport system permease protein